MYWTSIQGVACYFLYVLFTTRISDIDFKTLSTYRYNILSALYFHKSLSLLRVTDKSAIHRISIEVHTIKVLYNVPLTKIHSQSQHYNCQTQIGMKISNSKSFNTSSERRGFSNAKFQNTSSAFCYRSWTNIGVLILHSHVRNLNDRPQ